MQGLVIEFIKAMKSQPTQAKINKDPNSVCRQEEGRKQQVQEATEWQAKDSRRQREV